MIQRNETICEMKPNVNVCTELDLDPILTQPGPGPKLNSNLLLGEILQRHDADF